MLGLARAHVIPACVPHWMSYAVLAEPLQRPINPDEVDLELVDDNPKTCEIHGFW